MIHVDSAGPHWAGPIGESQISDHMVGKFRISDYRLGE